MTRLRSQSSPQAITQPDDRFQSRDSFGKECLPVSSGDLSRRKHLAFCNSLAELSGKVYLAPLSVLATGDSNWLSVFARWVRLAESDFCDESA